MIYNIYMYKKIHKSKDKKYHEWIVDISLQLQQISSDRTIMKKIQSNMECIFCL